jgi:hypothetical protein
MFTYIAILICFIVGRVVQLVRSWFHHRRHPDWELPMQHPPRSITPLPHCEPLYHDWAQHADCGHNIAFFLRPCNPDHSPVTLWPGETVEEAAASSLPASFIPGHYRWYPATQDRLWWARIQWEHRNNQKWDIGAGPFSPWESASDRNRPCGIRRDII